MGPAAILMAVGTAATVAGSIQESRFQQKVANRNADQARLNAQAEEVRFRRNQKRIMAADIAKRAAFGTLGGSDFDVLNDAALQIEEDAALIIHGGDEKSRAHKIEGDAAKISGRNKAISSGLLGGAQTANFAGF